MRFNTGKVLGISITLNPKKKILEEIQKYLADGEKPLVIVTPNPEQIVLAQGEKRFAEVLNQADIAIPDGIGVVWALKKQGIKNIQRFSGIELFEELVAYAAQKPVRTGLIGGWGKLAVETKECLQAQHAGLHIEAKPLPELIVEKGALKSAELSIKQTIEWIQKNNLRMVFVGVGAPKQELFIDALARRTSGPVLFMAVGGTFDIVSGKIRRAPVFVRTMGLEWLWRLTIQPWRWRRQVALLKFIQLVLTERFRSTLK